MLQRFSRRELVLVLGFFALGWTAYQTGRSLQQAAALTHNPDYDAEERIYVWLASADCAVKKNNLLTLCAKDGGVIPIEEVSLADDRGHALLLDLWARARQRPVDQTDLTALNILINGLGVLAVGTAFLINSMPVAALLALIAGTHYAIPGPIPGPDAPASYIGVLCLALVPVICLPVFFSDVSRLRKGLALFVSLCALTAACLLREPVGLIGVCAGEIFGLVLFWKTRPYLNVAWLVLGMVLFLLPVMASPGILILRNVLYGLPPARHVAMHGISQTLFHGLGTEPNPWGIEWADSYGYQLIQKMDPQAGYLTPAYFRILRGLYWNIVWHHPFQVLRIYAIKSYRVVTLPLRFLGMNLFLVSGILLAVLIFLWSKREESVPGPLTSCLGLSVAGGVFLLQGVIGIPWGNHLYPFKLLVLFILCTLAEAGWRSLLERSGR